ncbi:MAG: M20/M25/M40 family metallo-hydrolase [Holophagaceae bacterium]|nr:M20/M25/M40 family metallo-hydrolase [Holophagaceae bacterium]
MPKLVLALIAATTLLAQAPAPERNAERPKLLRAMDLGVPDAPSQSAAAKLIREVAENGRAFADLEELCDGIGPRLTGSEKLREAQRWAMAKLKAYGAVNVHEESYEFGKAWTRGVSRARLLNANGQEIHVAQMAWSPATDGVLKGEVGLLEAKTLEELKALLPALDGKIVVMGRIPSPGKDVKDRMAFYGELMGTMRQAKFKATLMESDKKDDLMNMTGSPAGRMRGGSVPTAFISKEHSELLKRLVARSQKPEVELELGGKYSDAPVRAYNVVADLPGSDKAEEVVLIGGHLDSWDLSTGATDNGTGCVKTMEVLRAMKALKLQPKRTLRVVLFSGEEQGLLGSEAYVKAHAAELDKFQAVLIDDLGSGRIHGWPQMGREDCMPALAAAMAPVNGLGCKDLPAISIPGATDHWPFHQKGVPAFAALQEPLDYFTATHHSQSDSLDHVVKEDLVQGAQVLAVTAWGLLNQAEKLPRKAMGKAAEPTVH